MLHLLDTYLVNTYILYHARMQRMGESVMSRVKFHYEVATKMCTSSVQRRRAIRHRAGIPNHDALHCTLFWTRSERKITQKKYVICGKRQQFYCPKCEDIPIYMDHCFVAHHHVLFACHLRFLLRFFSKSICVMIYVHSNISKNL